ncbi:MAG: J domain-containing protein, partial [Actinobacteria bacterium]|nr:J domain-containing protein [Actinomycetota bacterium]
MMALSLDEARILLGVTEECRDASAVRRAYLVAIRESHPDRNEAADANLRTARLSEAYRLICAAIADPSSTTTTPGGAAGGDTTGAAAGARTAPPPRATRPVGNEAETYEIEGWVRVIADDTIELGAPLDLAFRWLELACHHAGDITYLDRPAAMLQVLVQFVGYPPSYVVFDLQGRAAYGTTEVFCT